MTALDGTALGGNRIVPVVTIDDPAIAAELIAALAAGGITCAEITLRTASGLDAIRAVAGTAGFAIGAGTVLTARQVDACADAGATFVVSPGFDEEVVARAKERGIVALPGIATATELQRAVRVGLGAVKLFPIDLLGGLPMIAALSAPFPEMRFMPSGGITLGNVTDYLGHPSVFAAGGSWMVPRAALAARNFDLVERLSAEASAMVAQ